VHPNIIGHQYLPSVLREVCAILAVGLVRLRGHTAEDWAKDVAVARDPQDNLLHKTTYRSDHAKPSERERA
jgi:hypothetical protein